jgi:acyl carrier protein
MGPIRDDLQAIFRTVFDDDQIVLSSTTSANDIVGWDSMMHINLIIAIEKHFGLKFAAAEIAGTRVEGQNTDTLVDLIQRKLSGSGGGRR